MTVLTPFLGIVLRTRAAGGTRGPLERRMQGCEGEGPLHPHTPFAQALRQFSGRMWAYSGSYCCCTRTPPELLQECHADLVCQVFLRTPEPPEARTGSLGEISEEGGTPTPLTALTRGQREVLRAHLSGKGLIFGVWPQLKSSITC